MHWMDSTGALARLRGGSRVWKGLLKNLERVQGRIQSLERVAKKLKKEKKVSNNGCPLPNVFTIKYIKILIHSFIVKLHCMPHENTVTVLIE